MWTDSLVFYSPLFQPTNNREQEQLFTTSMDNEAENVWENVMKYVDLNASTAARKKKADTPKPVDETQFVQVVPAYVYAI